MLFLVKLNPEYSSKLLVEAKGTCDLFLSLLAAKKKAFIVSFRWDTKILTADRTAGSVAVWKGGPTPCKFKRGAKFSFPTLFDS